MTIFNAPPFFWSFPDRPGPLEGEIGVRRAKTARAFWKETI